MKHFIAAALAILLTLAGCGPIDSLKEGFAHSEAVSADLQKSLGQKTFVGFNWSNDTLTSVSVTFQGVPFGASLSEIAQKAQEAIQAEFKQTPTQVVISFAIDTSAR